MKSILVLSPLPRFAEEVTAALDPSGIRVVHRTGHDEAEPFLARSLVRACILDTDLTSAAGIFSVEKVRRLAPGCPIIAFTDKPAPEWEEQAYLQGANYVLSKPLRPRLLAALLDRLLVPAPAGPAPTQGPQPGYAVAVQPTQHELASSVTPATQTLAVLRNCSGILSHSLNAQGMLKQFLLLLREILSINRAAIFIKQPLAPMHRIESAESRRLPAVCSVGISNSLLEHFELSYDAGIGAQLLRSGRILRRDSELARGNLEAQKEFELLGGEVAVPILDRETVVGVAVLDGRVTGESLANSELQLVFHLLEQLGLALKNIWLHDQVTANHELMTGVLRELSSGCIVVNSDLQVVHANKTARRYFPIAEGRKGELDFSDLPQSIGAKVYQVLKTGAAMPSFRYEPDPSERVVYSINIVPFQRLPNGLPASALLMVEDLTQSEQLKKLELEAANARLLETMGDRLTNEIGNALVPLTVHQQLLTERMAAKKVETDFLRMLERDLAEHLRRIGRRNSQMKVLARSTLSEPTGFDLLQLLEEAAQEARKYQGANAGELKVKCSEDEVQVFGERWSLLQACTELILNGFQASPNEPKVTVVVQTDTGLNGRPEVTVDFRDNGPGFTAESATKASEPFWKNRVVGLGLGLTICRKIVELHGGRLQILVPKDKQPGAVRLVLPLGQAQRLAPG